MQSVAAFGRCKLTVLSFNPAVCNNKRSGRTIFKNRGNVLSPLAELVALFFPRAGSHVRWWLHRYWAPRAPVPLTQGGTNLWNGSRALRSTWDCGGEILTVCLYSHDGNITWAFGEKLQHRGDANSITESAAEQVDLQRSRACSSPRRGCKSGALEELGWWSCIFRLLRPISLLELAFGQRKHCSWAVLLGELGRTEGGSRPALCSLLGGDGQPRRAVAAPPQPVACWWPGHAVSRFNSSANQPWPQKRAFSSVQCVE